MLLFKEKEAKAEKGDLNFSECEPEPTCLVNVQREIGQGPVRKRSETESEVGTSECHNGNANGQWNLRPGRLAQTGTYAQLGPRAKAFAVFP